MRNTARKIKTTRESGYGLIFAAVGLVVLLGAAGLSVDMGYLRYQRRLMQSAADSAALAGAAQLGAGAGFAAAQLAAGNDAQLNGFQDGANLDGGTVSVTSTQTTINANGNTLQVQISNSYQTFFMRVLGNSFQNVTVSTVAIAQYLGGRGCIYALTGGGGLNIAGDINVPNCNVFSNEGISGGDSLVAAAIGSHGGSSGVATTPAVITGMQQTSDPLSYVATPPMPGGPCQNANYARNVRRGGQPPLSPGKYCSISIAAAMSQNVTFQSGNYFITGNRGVGLSLNGSGTVTGSGVTFYISGGSVQTSNTQKLQLTAQNNGLLFYQSAADNFTATIDAAGGSRLQGGFYFPNATLTLKGGGKGGADYMLFVAKTLNLDTDISFPSDYKSLPNSYSPIRTTVLIQ